MYQASKLYKNDETLPKNWKKHLNILEYQIFHLSMYQAQSFNFFIKIVKFFKGFGQVFQRFGQVFQRFGHVFQRYCQVFQSYT